MTKPPTYPEEASVGDPVGNAAPENLDSSEDATAEHGRKRQIVTGAAIGIGSAALVAALLYANRSRKRARKETPAIPPFTPEGAD